MPDHAHVIIHPKGDKNISQIMNRIKGVASRKINLARKKKGILWQEGYHDEIIRNEKQMLAAIDYIHQQSYEIGFGGESRGIRIFQLQRLH